MGIKELHVRLAIGPRQIVGALLAAALVVCTYQLVFSHQQSVLAFVSGGTTTAHRLLAVTVLAITVPLSAFTYGSPIRAVARLLHFE